MRKAESGGKTERSQCALVGLNRVVGTTLCFPFPGPCQHLGINSSSERCILGTVLPVLSLVDLTALLHYLNPVTGEQALRSSSKQTNVISIMGDSVSTVKYQYPKPLSEVLDKSQKKSVEHCLKHTHSRQGFYFKWAPRDHAIEPFPPAVASKVMEGTVNPE